MGRKSKTTVINSLDVNSNAITDPETIAEELNLHFSTIAERVQAEAETNYIKVPSDKNIDHYLSFIPRKLAPFKFKQITPEKIIKCIPNPNPNPNPKPYLQNEEQQIRQNCN